MICAFVGRAKVQLVNPVAFRGYARAVLASFNSIAGVVDGDVYCRGCRVYCRG